MKFIKKYINYLYLIIFFGLIIVSYNSSKRKPDSVMELFSDLKWLNNFPKWLDVPFMVWINDGWRAFNAKYGLIFDAIGYALIRAYSITKNFLVDVPWPIIVIGVVLLTFYASGKKIGTTRVFYKTGQLVPVTILKVEKARVIQIIDEEKSRDSNPSNIPPSPLKRFPESFTPTSLLSNDSEKSPS